jgi:nitrate/TMAO reductase-like tetraheme cytochrome c subunit
MKSLISKIKQLNWKVKILLLAAAAMVFASGAIVVSEQPGFCNSCHIMNNYYDNWKTSTHSEVNCLECHLQPGFMGHVKGKINGLSQAIDCIVGRVGTKPSATILDESCLRSECHSTEELLTKDINFNGIKFTHKNHMKKEVDGINITCGVCHSHFEGDEHFSVNNDACFTCHFLSNPETNEKLVKTSCTSCHEVPNKVIQRGLVSINHSEFVSYKASCEDSCHKKELQKTSKIDDRVCLNCHNFTDAEKILLADKQVTETKEHEYDSVELHKAHTNGHKVECFACHGKILHGQKEITSISDMLDCQMCHSDTHQVQRTIYATQHSMQDTQTDRVLSPMFLTHVECVGCHIEQARKKPGALDSFGKVAKAVPQACDNCHEPGTGQQYIPFWQEKIKQLHGQVSNRLEKTIGNIDYEADEKKAKEIKEKIAQAKDLVDSVEADGSWGVHNFKYSEAILLQANKIINAAQ